MKKFLLILLLLLICLSSCGYTAKDIDEMQKKWNSEYFDLEEKYYDALDRLDRLSTILSRIDESYVTAWCYYDDADPDITEDEAHSALLQIGEYLSEVGY